MDIKELSTTLTQQIKIDYDDCDDVENYERIRDIADLVNSLLIGIVAVKNDINPKNHPDCLEAENIQRMLQRKIEATRSILADLE